MIMCVCLCACEKQNSNEVVIEKSAFLYLIEKSFQIFSTFLNHYQIFLSVVQLVSKQY